MTFSDTELRALRFAMHMAEDEGGYEYPADLDVDVAALYVKIGGTVKTVTMTNGQPNSYFESPV